MLGVLSMTRIRYLNDRVHVGASGILQRMSMKLAAMLLFRGGDENRFHITRIVLLRVVLILVVIVLSAENHEWVYPLKNGSQMNSSIDRLE